MTLKQVMTATELLSQMILNTSWNTTYQGASIAKVLKYLSDNTFFEKIEKEERSIYNSCFKDAYEAWRATNSSDSELVLIEVLSILRKNGYKELVQNFCILQKHGIANEISSWCYGATVKPISPDGLIKAVHSISTFSIVEKKDGKFRYRDHVFCTLDEALIYAISVKYDGSNTQAHQYIFKMLGVTSYSSEEE